MATAQIQVSTMNNGAMGVVEQLDSPFVRRQSTRHPWPIEIEDDVNGYVQRVIDFYRRDGFPVYSLSSQQKLKRLRSLLKSAAKSRITKGVVGQNMSGLSLAWNYFPHAWEVRCGSMITPKEVFTDDVLLQKAIRKQLTHSSYISHVSMRKSLRFLSGAQGVSNFRPTAAAALYRRFLPASGGVVWDMSAGFGGRLLGALACQRVKRYIGTDPATVTMEGLCEMRDELVPMARVLGRSPLDVELLHCGSEDYTPAAESLDCCLSSEPYFNFEQYSDEPTQSYIKFPTKEEWLHGFIGGTLRNCHIGLKPQGKLVVNIANVRTYPDLESDFVTLADPRLLWHPLRRHQRLRPHWHRRQPLRRRHRRPQPCPRLRLHRAGRQSGRTQIYGVVRCLRHHGQPFSPFVPRLYVRRAKSYSDSGLPSELYHA